ncbi:hypothetical protein Poly24_10860 [Rosistilla carotiformis]|uniref:DUF1207 domain-containing protein n=1 Tax=Rosistilla carotiformis TaxID=2528017 RepID=A0A518JPD8_9BACT|nr:DUF1207 domain-containing protein [Rosistilla carotiformis]QDV67391.1 hypothetical protein Poly24_10860 [Rosistilla carotiformis]
MNVSRHRCAIALWIAVLCVDAAIAQRIASLEPRTYDTQPTPGAITAALNESQAMSFDPYETSAAQIAQLPPLPMAPLPFIPQTIQPLGSNAHASVWQWQLLPKDSIYPVYLADEKASRLAGRFTRPEGDNLLLDGTLGGRFGLFRFGDRSNGPFRHGMQLDIEGSAQVRLDMEEEADVRSVDFRAGVPLSFGFGRWQTRVGYYHLSSHTGDEFLLKNPDHDRLNFSRDVLFAGAAFWITERLRTYGEVGWAFYSDVSEQWEFMFGIEYMPTAPTGWRGAPFAAAHAHLREELDYGGSLTLQAGWAWRGHDGALLRLGADFYEGKSQQWSFFDKYEPLIGFGMWYDY